MKSIYVCFLLVGIGFFSCKNPLKFDSTKWSQQEDPAFPPPYRAKMLDDLIENHKLVGQKYSDLIVLLGQPNQTDSNRMSYQITVDYGTDIDPVYSKDLEFQLKDDSTVKSFAIREWKK